MLILTHHGMNSIYRDGEPEPSIDSVEIGGRTYRVVRLGDQYWIAENLDYVYDGCTLHTDTNTMPSSYNKRLCPPKVLLV